DWFGTNVSNVLGDGKDIGFWKEKWIGTEPLRDLFPSLYVKSALQPANLSAMGTWDNNIWSWKLAWSVPITESETAAAAEFFLLLDQVQPRKDSIDRQQQEYG
ncbi:putative ribonuclease H protein, partial [Trifolium medium]|nr:putative ribonuclease H protein [Trifolium medium]